MNIQDATKLALEKDLYIIRESSPFRKYSKIKPTDTSDCCMVYKTKYAEQMHGGKLAPGKRWNPDASDLLADDWIVTELNE
ncbi:MULTISPECIES: Thoeris anti-defense Tad2 family protein [Aneurinibacillus]|uniref:Thoeris anti-defense Tad2 family protein n=1 Tax=Aneurinibacillus TaxID=55079 RepID=UPI002E1F68F2|nr:aspartate ammonia-lyase [Aneurinibacillus migulanus]